MVALSDFTIAELQHALNAHTESMKEAHYFIEFYQKVEMEIPEKWQRQYDISQLWCTQVLNAMAIVRSKQTVNAN
jgi:hypothetical protein